MNRKQIRIAWWGIGLISIILAGTGIWLTYDYYLDSPAVFVILTFISPVVLLFGFGIIAAGVKKQEKEQKKVKK